MKELKNHLPTDDRIKITIREKSKTKLNFDLVYKVRKY